MHVITHNGFPVSQGGKRVGYWATDPVLGTVVLPIVGGPSIAELTARKAAARTTATQSAPVAVKPPVIRFDSLGSRNRRGYCSNCEEFVPERTRSSHMTDVGFRLLFQCSYGCGALLRDSF